LARLHTFVDRELTAEEAQEVQRHLIACPPCRDHFTFEVSMKRLVHSCICREAAPPGLRERILRECQEHKYW
jgi:mycothiol system anti-sigma-R factor